MLAQRHDGLAGSVDDVEERRVVDTFDSECFHCLEGCGDRHFIGCVGTHAHCRRVLADAFQGAFVDSDGSVDEVAAEKKAEVVVSDDVRAYDEESLSGVRRVIARQMHASLSEMAQLTLNASFDATALMNFRASLKASGEALGLGKISLNDMVLFAVSRTLLNYPEINANLVDDKFRKFKHANIGLAVDTERGLLVPTLFASEKLSLTDLSAYAKSAAAKAREGKLTPDEMSGGSFTVTNLGSLGIESFTPVINPPQTAILGVCAITYRLKADGTTYPAMGLSLTFDNRAVDGAPAARFLSDLCRALENFGLLLAK